MKIIVRLQLNTEIEIDLADCGYDERKKWGQLSECEQNDILDPMRDEAIPNVSVDEIDN